MDISSNKSDNKLCSVAVIGAGLSGLSCARTLMDAGLNVTVFEKSRGAGGRMSTRRHDNFQCDIGAQYFTARDSLFATELERWRRAGVAAEWQPRLHPGNSDKRHVADKKAARRFVGVPAMNSPLHLLSGGLEIHYSTRVVGISRDNARWQVRAEHGGSAETCSYDAVVLAVPAPQAALLLKELCSELEALCQRQVMHACWAVMLTFDQKLPIGCDAMFVDNGPLRWIARNNSKPGRADSEIWVLHACPLWTAQHLDHSPEQVTEVLLQAFCQLTGLPTGACQPQLRHAHRWLYARAETTQPPLSSYWRSHQRIGVCGDWLHDGRVEGAWLSGRHLADQILMSR